jgi:hypothetical protein
MRQFQFLVLLLTWELLLGQTTYAQLPTDRIKPATMFNAGDTVRSPRLGLRAVIPSGWQGVLPRDTEVFLLMPVDNTIAEIYVVLNENTDAEKQAMNWQAGMPMSDGITLVLDGPISQRGPDVMTAAAKFAGAKANNQSLIYLEAKCSPQGFCLTYVLTADQHFAEGAKQSLQALVDNTTFGRPTTESMFDNFDWQTFLAGKVLLAIDYDLSSKQSNEVHLCKDGSFKSYMTRAGIFRDQGKQYQGKKRGTWKAASEGEKATVTFSFEKLQPVEVVIEARGEQIYVNGKRSFIGDSDDCE